MQDSGSPFGEFIDPQKGSPSVRSRLDSALRAADIFLPSFESGWLQLHRSHKPRDATGNQAQAKQFQDTHRSAPIQKFVNAKGISPAIDFTAYIVESTRLCYSTNFWRCRCCRLLATAYHEGGTVSRS
jgi:hypothetical protein